MAASDPYVCCLGAVEDFDGRAMSVGTDYDCVTIGQFRFTSTQLEEVAQLLVHAAWQAAANSERMKAEAADV